MINLAVPEKELERRIMDFQERLQSSGADGAFLVQRADLYYFSGNEDVDCIYVPPEGKPFCFFVDSQLCPYHLDNVACCDLYYINELEEIKRILKNSSYQRREVIGVEWDVISFLEFQSYKNLFEGSEFFDISSLILSIRARKSAWELEQMRKVACLSSDVFDAISYVIEPGMTEMDLSSQAESVAQKKGQTCIHVRVRDYKTEGYPWHVLSGPNGGMIGLLDSPASGLGTSAAFPCGASHRRIQANEPVMVDFAFGMDGYHMDETRMFSIGTMPDDAMRASEAAIKIHNYVLEHVRPGVRAGDLFNYSVSKAHELGYADTYLGPQGYQVSFVGHGIGTELIEWPLIAKGREDILEPGMTFALEPKIVFKDQFIAGVESVVAVTEDGFELISKVPVEVFIC